MQTWRPLTLVDGATLGWLGDRALRLALPSRAPAGVTDRAATARARAVAAAVRRLALPAIRDVVASYHGVLFVLDAPWVDGDARATAARALVAALPALLGAPLAPAAADIVEVPVWYGTGDEVDDLPALASRLGLAAAEVTARHSAPIYDVAFLGFAPGFGYLQGLDPSLAAPRRQRPRLQVPAGSVAIGGGQTAVFPQSMPSGWHVIGRTPLRLFDERWAAPALLTEGGAVRFRAIDAATYATWPATPTAGGAHRHRDGRGHGGDGAPGAAATEMAPGTGWLDCEEPGPCCALQDDGRHGARHLGVATAGAADAALAATARALAGAASDAPVIESLLQGGRWRWRGPGVLGVAIAGDVEVAIDGFAAAPWRTLELPPGATLRVGAIRSGLRCYLALAAPLELPATLGSVAWHARSGLGGFAGRSFRRGDRLVLALPAAPPRILAVTPPPLPLGRLRLLPGPHADRLDAAGLAALWAGPWQVDAASDRMGMRLRGPQLPLRGGADIVSEAVVPGCLQVPGDGQPLVLGVDAGTTGGYAIVAVVVADDLPQLGQLAPGATVTCQPATPWPAPPALGDGEAAGRRWAERAAAAVTPVPAHDRLALTGRLWRAQVAGAVWTGDEGAGRPGD